MKKIEQKIQKLETLHDIYSDMGLNFECRALELQIQAYKDALFVVEDEFKHPPAPLAALINAVQKIAFGAGSAQERMADIKALFNNGKRKENQIHNNKIQDK